MIKASDLVEQLQNLIAEHGDYEVYIATEYLEEVEGAWLCEEYAPSGEPVIVVG